MAKKKAASGKRAPKKNAVAHKSPAKKKSAAVGALAAPALPPDWQELFCREADYGGLVAALVLLHATYPAQPPSTTGRYDNLNIKKLMKMMVPRVNGNGDAAAGARVFLQNDQGAAVFLFLRLLHPGEAYCVTIGSRSGIPSTLYPDLVAIGKYARSTANVKPLEIISKTLLPGDLSDVQDPAIVTIFNTASRDNVFELPLDQINPPSPPWPAGPLWRYKIR
jgi:hypothetical protein